MAEDCLDCTPEQKLTGYGAMLAYCDPISGEQVIVGGTKDLEFPERSVDEIETTSNDGDGYRTWIPSDLKTVNSVTYTIDFLPAQWLKLNNIWHQERIMTWAVILSDNAASMKFCAFIMTLSDAIPMEDLITSDITLRPTGKPEWSAPHV